MDFGIPERVMNTKENKEKRMECSKILKRKMYPMEVMEKIAELIVKLEDDNRWGISMSEMDKVDELIESIKEEKLMGKLDYFLKNI